MHGRMGAGVGAVAALATAVVAAADPPAVSVPLPDDVPALASAPDEDELAVAPIPFSNPALGPGIAMVAAWMHHLPGQATATPPSVLGLGAFASVNGSWGVAGGHQAVLADDDLRLTWGAGVGQLNYDFYGVGDEAGEEGRSVPIEQRFGAGLVQGVARLHGPLFVGLRLAVARIEIRLGDDVVERDARLQEVALPLWQVGAGIPIQFDSRDSRFWPTRGAFGEVVGTAYDPAIGSDVEYRALSLAWNHYLSWTSGHVIAVRAATRAASDGAPFYALPAFGSQSDLRGYTPGRYRDQLLVAVQAEYRWRWHERWAVAAFAGLGDIAPELAALADGGVLPAAGIGLRWLVAPRNGVGLRLDVAAGRDEAVGYLALGEAF